MDKRNKFISLILAIVTMITIIMPSGIIATTPQTDLSLISEIGVKENETIDGSGTLDSEEGQGNDTSTHNGIVRSFDSISYTLEYITILKTQEIPESANLMVEFKLPCTKDVAIFDLGTMNWLQNPQIEEINGEQILTGSRHLQNQKDKPNVIPGQGTLSVGIQVKAAKNGTIIQPSFKAWMEGNTEEEKQETIPSQITVTAAPKYDVDLDKTHGVDYRCYVNPETGDYSLTKFEGSKFGRIQGYGMGLMLYNDSPEKGLKGIELPEGDIEFDVVIDELESRGGNVITKFEGYTPFVWDYRENNYYYGNDPQKKLGKLNHNIYWIYDNSCYAVSKEPWNKRFSKYFDSASCYDGGTWTMTQTGENTYHFVVSDYKFDPEFIFPIIDAGDSEEATHKTANIGYFSTGFMQVFCQFPYPENVEKTKKVYISVEAKNMKATSRAGEEGIEVNPSNNKEVHGITLFPDGHFIKEIAFKFPQDGSYLTYPLTSYGDAFRMPGQIVGLKHDFEQRYDMPFVAADALVKFDDKAFKFPEESKRYFKYYGHTQGVEKGQTKWLFAAKPDKTGWTDFAEQEASTFEDLIYFESIDELVAQGYTCVGYLTESRNWNESKEICSLTDLQVREDVKTNATYAVVSNVRAWHENFEGSFLTYEYKDGSYNLGEDGLIIGYPKLDFHSESKDYIKTEYDKNGDIIPGTHSEGRHNGNSLLIVEYNSIIENNIITKDSAGNKKTKYDVDANERTVDFELKPSTESDVTDATTNLYIEDKLPKDLIYIPNSATWGGQPLEPEIITKEDGSSTLKWTLKDVPLGTTLDGIKFSCIVGKAGTNEDVKNNQRISHTATIWGDNDNKKRNPENKNVATETLTCIKLSAISVFKTTDTPLVQLGQNFNYKMRFANNSQTEMTNAKLYDVLPYNNDFRHSKIDGFYKINTISIDFSNALTSYEDYKNQNFKLGYTSDTNIQTSDFNTIKNYDKWIKTTASQIDDGTHIITYTSLPEDLKALFFNLNLKAQEYIEVELNITPTGEQLPGNMYINDFYQYADNQVDKVISNKAIVTVFSNMYIEKEWIDEDNFYDTRPKEITLTLFQNSEKYQDYKLSAKNTLEDNPNIWRLKLDTIPLTDNKGEPYVYTIQEQPDPLLALYCDPIYSKDELKVTNEGIWPTVHADSKETPSHSISINKKIEGSKGAAMTEEYELMGLKESDVFEFPVTLKKLKLSLSVKDGKAVESYGEPTGDVFQGIVTNKNTLTFMNIPAGKYEISERAVEYFKFKDIVKVNSSSEAIFTEENGKYYVTISFLSHNNENITLDLINTIDSNRPYEDVETKINLFS